VRDLATTPLARRVALGAGALALLGLAATARVQTTHWRDTETLFRHAATVTEDNFLANQWVGALLLRRGEIDEAEERFREALRSTPDWAEAQRGLADVYAARRDWPQAIRAYDRALRLAPRDARGQLRLARALAADGQPAEALGRARHAVRLAEGPVVAEAQTILGSILAQRGALPEAIVAFDAAIAVNPALAEAHAARGLALLEAGRLADGDAALATARQLGISGPSLAAGLAEAARRAEDRDQHDLANALAERRAHHATLPAP
jgi:tetratricopeptide (TPR) repeat protein